MNETNTVNEYRCTRGIFYRDPNCAGHLDLAARQGHYVQATSEAHALARMRAFFPNENDFTVDLWKADVYRNF